MSDNRTREAMSSGPSDISYSGPQGFRSGVAERLKAERGGSARPVGSNPTPARERPRSLEEECPVCDAPAFVACLNLSTSAEKRTPHLVCDKQRIPTAEKAQRAIWHAFENRGWSMRSYYCETCKCWHLTAAEPKEG